MLFAKDGLVVRWLFMLINSKEYSKQADEEHRFSLHFARIVKNKYKQLIGLFKESDRKFYNVYHVEKPLYLKEFI